MVYLNNNTELQEVWIPKNDGTGSSHKPNTNLEGVEVTISADTTVVHPSSGYYGMSAVTIDATEYGQQNYDSGFDDGYTDGYASGSTEGYESGYTSGYTSGSTDGYNSGYTSGETHQKSLLVSTAFTQNGQYTRENGWNGVTVNIDTASTYNSGYTFGYTSGHTDGVDEEKAKMSAVTFTANTAVTLSDGSYSAVTVNVPQTGSTAVLGVGSFSANGTYSASTDNLDGYSAITVNVPQTGSTNSIISVTGNTWYVLDHYFGTGEQIEITNATFDYSVANGGRHQQLIAGGDGEWVRIGGNGDNLYTSYYGNSKIDVGPTILDDDHILLTNGAFYINDMETPVSTFGPYQLDIFKDTRMVVFANTAIGQDSVCGQTASVGVITIYDENDNVVDKYVPELHNGVVCLHNVISGNYITPSGTGTPTITNTDYSDGYNDGRQDVIDTFTAITATTNGIYGSSAHPLSSITVNVPHTGSSGVKYVEYIETDGTNIVYDTGIKITSNNVKIYLDYMRLSGSTSDYTGLVSQMYNDMLFSYLFFVPGNWNRDIIMPRFGGDNYEVPSLLDTYYETVVSNTGTTINGVDYPHTFSGFQETDEHMYLNAQHHYGSFRRFAIARYYRFAVESGGTLLVDMRPALDENNIPCFYDEVSETYIYHTGSGTPIAGPVLDPSYASGYTDGQNSIISTFTAMTATTNGVYGSSANPLSSITVNVDSSAKKLYVTVNDVKQNVQYYSQEATVWKVVNENYTTDTPLEIFYVHYYEYKLHIYLLSSGKYGYWDEDENNPQPMNITTINGSATTQDSLSTYTMTEDGAGLIVTSNNGSYYEVLVSEEISELSAITITSNTAITVNNGGYSAITVNVPQSGSNLDYANLIQKSISGTCYIPSSCTKIGYGVFGSCTGLTGHLDIPDSITNIGAYSFYDCSGFTGDLVIPNSVTNIGERAFQACFGLTALTLSSSLTYVGIGAFAGCTGLTGNLILPDSLTGIYNYAFTNCSSLTGITLGNYVTHIYGYAFSNCSNISSIEIPNSVTNIDNCAFSGCSSLSTIYCYPTTSPYLGSLVFDSVSQNGTLHYPSGSDYSSWQNDSNLSGWTFIGDL